MRIFDAKDRKFYLGDSSIAMDPERNHFIYRHVSTNQGHKQCLMTHRFFRGYNASLNTNKLSTEIDHSNKKPLNYLVEPYVRALVLYYGYQMVSYLKSSFNISLGQLSRSLTTPMSQSRPFVISDLRVKVIVNTYKNNNDSITNSRNPRLNSYTKSGAGVGRYK